MKTKKVIIGAIAASMLSLSVCSVAPVSFAAGETVQISVGKDSAEAGEQFEVEVTLADIPSTGIQALEFVVNYDDSIISIESIEAGSIADTGAVGSDPTASVLPVFDVLITDDYASIAWSTSLSDSSYWLKKDGVLCTIKGKVSSTAKDGDVAKLEVAANDRLLNPDASEKNDEILCGYSKEDNTPVNYDVSVSHGSVTVGGEVKQTLAGDSNVDGKVNLADAVFIMQYKANPSKYAITEQGAANGDVDDPGSGITNKDALLIQQYLLGIVSKL